MSHNKINIAFGDGIGPEIMESTLSILRSSGADISFEIIELGEEIYKKGFESGIMPSAFQKLANNKIILKAPITTPQGKGYKSLNVTLRKKLNLFANVRPVINREKNIDLVIIRENSEDLYSGIEYQLSHDTYHAIKIITKSASYKIIKYAFEYARKNNRHKITAMSKDNIMKMTDGCFHDIFNKIAKEYPEIESDHYIIDIGSARIASKPQDFDVIVTSNLYGDIISDIAAEISSSVGSAGSANIGNEYAMFEAIHGSAPKMSGKNIANPTALINASIMMLRHIGKYQNANLIENSINEIISSGYHTKDLYKENISKKLLSTTEFTDMVIDHMSENYENYLTDNNEKDNKSNEKINDNDFSSRNIINQNYDKKLIGFDINISWLDNLDNLIKILSKFESDNLHIRNISAKGLLLYPLLDEYLIPDYDTDILTIRFLAKDITANISSIIIDQNKSINHNDLIMMLDLLNQNNIDYLNITNLYNINGNASYSAYSGE